MQISNKKIRLTASVVTFKTNIEELNILLDCAMCSTIETIYIVDNSPSDELRSLSNLSPKIEYIFGHGNIGYGSAHNIAINKAIEAEAKYHIVLNPDIYFEIGTIESLTKFMEENTSVGQMMPKVVYPNGDLQFLCKLLPSPMDLFGRRFMSKNNYTNKLNERFEMRASGYNKQMVVPFLSGCFMFFRVDALKKVQGFDDSFFMYCEDIDLCRRIGMAGYQTIYYPNVTIVHAHKKESFKSRTMLKAHIKSAFKYFSKWGWFFDAYRTKTNKLAIKQYKTTV